MFFVVTALHGYDYMASKYVCRDEIERVKDEKETETAGGTQLACGSMGGMDYESTSHKGITKELTDKLSVNTAIRYSW